MNAFIPYAISPYRCTCANLCANPRVSSTVTKNLRSSGSTTCHDQLIHSQLRSMLVYRSGYQRHRQPFSIIAKASARIDDQPEQDDSFLGKARPETREDFEKWFQDINQAARGSDPWKGTEFDAEQESEDDGNRRKSIDAFDGRGDEKAWPDPGEEPLNKWKMGPFRFLMYKRFLERDKERSRERETFLHSKEHTEAVENDPYDHMDLDGNEIEPVEEWEEQPKKTILERIRENRQKWIDLGDDELDYDNAERIGLSLILLLIGYIIFRVVLRFLTFFFSFSFAFFAIFFLSSGIWVVFYLFRF